MRTAEKLKFLSLIQYVYAGLGLLAMTLFATKDAWISFLLGALFSYVNFEILKRLGLALRPLVIENKSAAGVGPLVSKLVFAKVVFLGLLLAFLVFTNKVQAIPFVIGMLGLLIAGIGLGIKEAIYA